MVTMRMKVALAVAGASLLAVALIGTIFFSFAGWPRLILVFIGALMTMPLWEIFAGIHVPTEKRRYSSELPSDDWLSRDDDDRSRWYDMRPGIGIGKDD